MTPAERAQLDELLADAKDLEDTSLQRAIRREFKKGLEATTIREKVAAVEEPDADGHPFALDPGFAGHEAVYIAGPPTKGYQLPTLDEALATMWDAQREYSAHLGFAVEAHLEWSAVDNVSSRERYAATLRLMEAMKISSAAADKIATQDAGYAAHRDELARLLNEKLDAEAERDDCLSKLISARVTVEALTAQLVPLNGDTVRLDLLADWAYEGDVSIVRAGPTNEDVGIEIKPELGQVAQTLRGAIDRTAEALAARKAKRGRN